MELTAHQNSRRSATSLTVQCDKNRSETRIVSEKVLGVLGYTYVQWMALHLFFSLTQRQRQFSSRAQKRQFHISLSVRSPERRITTATVSVGRRVRRVRRRAPRRRRSTRRRQQRRRRARRRHQSTCPCTTTHNTRRRRYHERKHGRGASGSFAYRRTTRQRRQRGWLLPGNDVVDHGHRKRQRWRRHAPVATLRIVLGAGVLWRGTAHVAVHGRRRRR